jgi:copper chaperone CopZ
MVITPKQAFAHFSKLMKKLFALIITSLCLICQADDKLPAGVKPYPLDYCVVSNEKLGSMGQPVVFIFENQEIKLCCKECRKDFDADPKKFLEKINNPSKETKTSTPATTPSQSGIVVQLTVDGLVCNFCATNISKTFSKLPEVAEVYVNLAAKAVLLQLKEGKKLPEDQTKQIVTEAGFNLRGINYPKESFNAVKESLKKSTP